MLGDLLCDNLLGCVSLFCAPSMPVMPLNNSSNTNCFKSLLTQNR